MLMCGWVGVSKETVRGVAIFPRCWILERWCVVIVRRGPVVGELCLVMTEKGMLAVKFCKEGEGK